MTVRCAGPLHNVLCRRKFVIVKLMKAVKTLTWKQNRQLIKSERAKNYRRATHSVEIHCLKYPNSTEGTWAAPAFCLGAAWVSRRTRGGRRLAKTHSSADHTQRLGEQKSTFPLSFPSFSLPFPSLSFPFPFLSLILSSIHSCRALFFTSPNSAACSGERRELS